MVSVASLPDDNSAQTNPVPAAAANAGRTCAECQQKDFKYRCPACDTRTCSLACAKAHKQATGCTGKRSCTEMVTLADFTERQLLSDYKFLEEASRLHDVAQRSEVPRPARQLPHGLQMFVNEAKRRDIRYELLPPGMHRRRLNSSRYDRRSRTISWHVEWRFPAADVTVHEAKVSEQTPLQQALAKHLKQVPGKAVRGYALRGYAEAGLDSLHILMRKEHCPANDPMYHKLDASKFLRQLLAGKVVIEFPVVVVLLPTEVNEYHLVDESAQSHPAA